VGSKLTGIRETICAEAVPDPSLPGGSRMAMSVGHDAERGDGVGQFELDRRLAVGVGNDQRLHKERFREIAPHIRLLGRMQMSILAAGRGTHL